MNTKILTKSNLQNFEIIFHDDNSNDKSVEIIKEIAKKIQKNKNN